MIGVGFSFSFLFSFLYAYTPPCYKSKTVSLKQKALRDGFISFHFLITSVLSLRKPLKFLWRTNLPFCVFLFCMHFFPFYSLVLFYFVFVWLLSSVLTLVSPVFPQFLHIVTAILFGLLIDHSDSPRNISFTLCTRSSEITRMLVANAKGTTACRCPFSPHLTSPKDLLKAIFFGNEGASFSVGDVDSYVIIKTF